jgi:transposase
VTWPLSEDFDDRRLDELLFPKRPLRTPSQPRPGLDFAQLHTQLQTHKHLTLQLLWEEYRETKPDGYGYSRYVAAVFMLREHLKAMTVPGTGNVLAT